MEQLATRARREGASATVELLMLMPMLMAFLALMVILGRLALSKAQVNDAVRAAAQAGVVAPDAPMARSAARSAALSTLAGDHITCASAQVVVDTTDFVPGGKLSVRLACTVSFAQVALPGLPGSETLRASLTAPVDPYRGVGS
ncbi:MAG: TadE/TadG family type IV pilus assembly protein [Acidimicrobiales bacterium]